MIYNQIVTWTAFAILAMFFIIVVEPAHAEVPLSNDVSGVAASPHLLQHLFLKPEDQLRFSS